MRAHPRSRGENVRVTNHCGGAPGSSPLTRGKPRANREGRIGEGLIPAHAGKTLASGRGRKATEAHPRSRGENSHARPRPDWTRGSSPLTRGKHAASVNRRMEHGLIPAHAGKTSLAASPSSRRPAHPRSRGENTSRTAKSTAHGGSSPLTRGKLSRQAPSWLDTGLIPAHAGKTSRARSA